MQVFVQFDVDFSRGTFLNEHKQTISTFDLTKPITASAQWMCFEPRGREPGDVPRASADVQLSPEDIAVVDVAGHVVISYGGKPINFTRFHFPPPAKPPGADEPQPFSDLWCASTSNPSLTQGDGTASDDVQLKYKDVAVAGLRAKNINFRTFPTPYVAVGATVPLCSTCQRSFMPASAATVRAILPFVQLAGGWPKVIEFRLELGASAGVFLASASSVNADGLALAPVGGLCIGVYSSKLSPTACVYAALDLIGAATTTSPAMGPSTTSINFGAQADGMGVLGVTLP